MKLIKNVLFIFSILFFSFLFSVNKSSNAETEASNLNNSYFIAYDESGGQALAPSVFKVGGVNNINIDRLAGGNIIVAYSDTANSSAGTFSVYEPLGSRAIAPIVFNSGETNNIAVKNLSSGYIFLAYSDAANSSAGTFSIYNSLGSLAIEPAVFSNSQTNNIKIIELTNGNIFIAYTDASNLNYGKFVVYGSNGIKALGPVEFNAGETSNISIAELANENILIAYSNGVNSSYGEFVIYNQSGDKVSGPTVFNPGLTENTSVIKLVNDNVFIAYTNRTNSGYGELIIYDTNLGELLMPVVFNPGDTDNIEITQLASENIFITYTNEGGSSNGEFVIVNSSGEKVIGSIIFNTGKTRNISITKTLSGYIFMAYSDISVIECVDSDWLPVLEPANCPSSGLQIKKWELIGECAGGVSHPESEEVGCSFTPELPICEEADWQYLLEPLECPGSGTQVKKWELSGECAGGVSHPESEEASCGFSKVINGAYLDILKGKIILRVEANGEAYYINNTGMMFYLGRPADAFRVMREQGAGITNSDLEKIPIGSGQAYSAEKISNSFAAKHKGKIFLQVEANGEAWYVYPNDSKRYYLGRPADAFNVMRNLGLGISNADFNNL